MKIFLLFVLACLGTMSAQAPPQQLQQMQTPPPPLPNVPDETVVAVFYDGVKLTMGDFKKIYAILPPQNQQLFARDPKAFMEQYGWMRKLTLDAEKEKLDQTSPAKETLEYARMAVLAPMMINKGALAGTVENSEIVKIYGENKEKYKQVKVKAIYIAFSSDPSAGGKKRLTEAEAEAKAKALLTKIQGGADFVTLVKENSDDETSKAANGDFVTLRQTDNVPDALKSAVFALKQGETAGPLRQASGFYLLKAEEVSYRPLSQVRDEIYNDIKNQQYAQWIQQSQRDAKIEFPSADFLKPVPVNK